MKGVAHPSRSEAAPDFVMKNMAAYIKKGRKHRQAH